MHFCLNFIISFLIPNRQLIFIYSELRLLESRCKRWMGSFLSGKKKKNSQRAQICEHITRISPEWDEIQILITKDTIKQPFKVGSRSREREENDNKRRRQHSVNKLKKLHDSHLSYFLEQREYFPCWKGQNKQSKEEPVLKKTENRTGNTQTF